MTFDSTVAESMRQMRNAGPRLPESLVRQVVKHSDTMFPALLELATQLELFDEDGPQRYAPIHALRLLGQVPRAEMIEPLLRTYPVEIAGEWDELPRIWAGEVPQMIGQLGAGAIAPLWQVVDSAEWGDEARTIAVLGLCSAVTVAPDERAAVVEGLRVRLRSEEDLDARSRAMVGLANLGVADEYGEIMGLFRSGKVDKDLMAPGLARQLLLTGGDKSLNCTLHTLEERYAQHGPKA